MKATHVTFGLHDRNAHVRNLHPRWSNRETRFWLVGDDVCRCRLRAESFTRTSTSFMISSFKMSALANEWLQTYWKLLGIIFVAFALRVAVRCYSGSEDFWINGYTFYFTIAQNIAAGESISFGD